MVLVKHWDFGTGHLEVVATKTTQTEAQEVLDTCLREDHATDAVYYLDEVNDEE